MNNKKGNPLGLLPLVVFLVLYMGVGLGSGSFENMPLMIGIAIASVVALALNDKKNKMSFDSKVDLYCKGGGENTLILMVIIFLLAGAFGGVAKGMGAADSIVNFGLSIMPTSLLLPGIFLIGCLLSFAMGTSMGTVSTLMPIAISLANATGINICVISGAVVGGAMFGDNLSFISDTTIAATRTQEVTMKTKFKVNFLQVLPAVIVTCVLLAFAGSGSSQISVGSWSFVNIIPYILVVVLSLIGMNVMPVMGIGIASGVLIGCFNGSFDLIGSLAVIHDGAVGMEDMALIAVLVGGMVELMRHFGGMDYLLSSLTKNVKNAKGGAFAIALLVSLLDIATTNNTISIIAAGPIAREIADKYGIARARVASILDLFSCACNGLIPYGGQLLVAGGMAGVAPMAIMPYVWYCMLMLVSAIVCIIIGFPHIKLDEGLDTTAEVKKEQEA